MCLYGVFIAQQQDSCSRVDRRFKEIIQWITFVRYRANSLRMHPDIDLSVSGVISGRDVAWAKEGFYSKLQKSIFLNQMLNLCSQRFQNGLFTSTAAATERENVGSPERV